MRVLVIGYGSIGKQHSRSLVALGHTPVVFTQYPDESPGVEFISELKGQSDISAAIICTPTYQHRQDFEKVCNQTSIKYVLIEKPIAHNIEDAMAIKDLAIQKNVEVKVAFDMRFIPALNKLKARIPDLIQELRIVKISCGQYLPTWRPNSDYRKSYSAQTKLGGGVDLDLTHEIDYMLWLFGEPKHIEYVLRDKLSSLEINAIDYFKALYRYDHFLVDLELDYIRPLERKIILLGENMKLAEIDFISKKLEIGGDDISCDFSQNPLVEEQKDFLSIALGKLENTQLCSLEEAISVMKNLGNNV